MNKQKLINDFNEFILTALNSKAYRKVCREIYGEDILMLNVMDKQQLHQLYLQIDKISFQNILDVGCGTGELLKKIAEKKQCRGLGIDFADKAVAELNKRTCRNVTYQALEIAKISELADKFDLILAADSLFLFLDIKKTIQDFLNLRTGNGKIIIFFTEYVFEDGAGGRLQNKMTSIDNALAEYNVKYESYDFTTDELNFWKLIKEKMETYKSSFIAEGNEQIYQCRIDEAGNATRLIQNGKALRKMYVI